MRSSDRSVEAFVLVNGRPVTEVSHNGNTYIEGRKGSEFTLRVKNNTWNRILVIPSVDGLCTLDGEECGLESGGFVIEAHKTLDIPGWTLPLEEDECADPGVTNSSAGQFIFRAQGAPDGSRRQTYAEAMDKGGNQGVIGFMVFEELTYTFPGELLKKSFIEPGWQNGGYGGSGSPVFGGNTVIGGDTFRSASSSVSSTQDSYSAEVKGCVEPEPSLGAGMGREVDFKTTSTTFLRKTTEPKDTLVFYYDTIKNLKAKGVPTHLFRPQPLEESNPFPASPHVHRPGCKTPPGYRRRHPKFRG